MGPDIRMDAPIDASPETTDDPPTEISELNPDLLDTLTEPENNPSPHALIPNPTKTEPQTDTPSPIFNGRRADKDSPISTLELVLRVEPPIILSVTDKDPPNDPPPLAHMLPPLHKLPIHEEPPRPIVGP
jgi:hypothetical protein